MISGFKDAPSAPYLEEQLSFRGFHLEHVNVSGDVESAQLKNFLGLCETHDFVNVVDILKLSSVCLNNTSKLLQIIKLAKNKSTT